MRFRGIVYRAHDPRWAFAPLSGEGAAKHGGRFNRRGRPALYAALSIQTMIKEAQQSFGRKLDPLTIASYDVDCEDVVDLTDESEMQRLGVAAAELACAWQKLASARRRVPSWLLAERLVKQGHAAAIMPSYARGATGRDRNLVFWTWGAELPHRVVVHDPDGRLPKNRSSWS